MATAGACNNKISEAERTSHIRLLEKLLENGDVEYFLRNLITAEMLGQNPDIDGATEISHKISAGKAEEIFTDRIKKLHIKILEEECES